MHPHFHKTRYFKVQGRTKPTGWSYQRYVEVPEIKLSGYWLGEHGFLPKNRIKVTVRKDVLLIQPVKEENYGNKES